MMWSLKVILISSVIQLPLADIQSFTSFPLISDEKTERLNKEILVQNKERLEVEDIGNDKENEGKDEMYPRNANRIERAGRGKQPKNNATIENQSNCVCGIQNKRRIVGGTEARPHEYPWMVFLVHKKEFLCGGSLINNRFILTAAHCTKGLNKNDFRVVLGAHNLTKDEPERKIMKVKKILNYPRYVASLSLNDISLIMLDSEVQYTDTIRPICLPPLNGSYDDENVTASGWGLLKEGGRDISPVLQKVNVKVIPNKVCKEKYSPSVRIFDSMMCAGDLKGGKDACQGDSGGPLMHQLDDQLSVVGVVSFGIGCARDSYPGIYTRVDRFLSWIERNTAEANYCAKTISSD